MWAIPMCGAAAPQAPALIVQMCIRDRQQVLAYAKTKPARDGLKAQKSEKARAAYRQANESDFIIAEAAARYFKAHGITKLPARKALQAEIEQLISEKDGLYNTCLLYTSRCV